MVKIAGEQHLRVAQIKIGAKFMYLNCQRCPKQFVANAAWFQINLFVNKLIVRISRKGVVFFQTGGRISANLEVINRFHTSKVGLVVAENCAAAVGDVSPIISKDI